MGYGVLFTVVGDFRDEYGISEARIGVLIGIGFLAGFVAQVVLAPLADRGYARVTVIASVVASAAGLVLMGFGESFTPILIGRVISGIGAGASRPAVQRIVVLSDPANLGRNLGRLISADVFGFALGPAVSAVLVGPLGLEAPFLVVAAASMLALAGLVGVTVDEGERSENRQRLALDLLKSRVVAGGVVLGCAVFVMIGAFDALWDIVHEDLGTATWLANLGITIFAVPLIVLGPLGGRLAQDFGPFRMAAAGLGIAAVFMFLYGQLPSGGWIFGFMMFHALSDGITLAASGVAIAMAVPDERQAGAQGLLGASQALGAGITAIVIGAVYEGSGRAAAYTTAAAIMVVLTLGGVWLALPFIRARRSDDATDQLISR
jgi:MFS family permease